MTIPGMNRAVEKSSFISYLNWNDFVKAVERREGTNETFRNKFQEKR